VFSYSIRPRFDRRKQRPTWAPRQRRQTTTTVVVRLRPLRHRLLLLPPQRPQNHQCRRQLLQLPAAVLITATGGEGLCGRPDGLGPELRRRQRPIFESPRPTADCLELSPRRTRSTTSPEVTSRRRAAAAVCARSFTITQVTGRSLILPGPDLQIILRFIIRSSRAYSKECFGVHNFKSSCMM